jgi:hypothetical protein
LLIFGFSFMAALVLAILIATVITLGIAYALHGGVTALVTRWGDPLVSYDRLKKFFILPAFVLMVLSILAYVAIQRLDPETLYALQPVLSSAKFTAMLGFMIFGTGLLAAADLLDWSLPRSAKYEALKNERQKIASTRREWEEELSEMEEEERERGKQGQAQVAAAQEPHTAAPTPSPNGNAGGPPHGAAKAIASVIVVVAAVGLSACLPPTPQVKKNLVQGDTICEIVMDASGPADGQGPQHARRQALRQAGLNVLGSVERIVERERVDKLSVYWFGYNGWNAEQKLTLDLPPLASAEAVGPGAGDLGAIRPDVRDYERQRNEKAVAEAGTRFQSEYRAAIKERLAAITIDTLVPPPTAESPCSDLNGTLARFSRPASGDTRKIVILVSDGRQNCQGEYDIENTEAQLKGVVVVVVLIPGSESDGSEDFEARSKRFSEACPQCVIVPYYREDLDQVVSEAFSKVSVASSK